MFINFFISHQIMSNKRVKIYLNQDQIDGKLLLVPNSFDLLLTKVCEKFSINIPDSVLYTEDNLEVDDVDVIRDDEKLFIHRNNNYHGKKDLSADSGGSMGDLIKLNIGGKIFCTTRGTLIGLETDSVLSKMFSKPSNWTNRTDSDGCYVIDRTPQYFIPLLNYLRHGKLILDPGVNPQGVLEEAEYFGFPKVIAEAKKLIENSQKTCYVEPLTRSLIIKTLLNTTAKCELRYQGINFTGADLSSLDLRYINFKLANLSGCNLSNANLYCCSFERADLTGANLNGANMQGVRMICCNAEGSTMKACNFEDPSGLKANMEGANMKGVDFEGSLMGGAILRVATLKNSNLKNLELNYFLIFLFQAQFLHKSLINLPIGRTLHGHCQGIMIQLDYWEILQSMQILATMMTQYPRRQLMIYF